MRYLLIFIFILVLGSCKDPKVETLEAEKAGLILLYQKEADKTQRLENEALALTNKANEEAANARKAEAEAMLALEEAEQAMEKLRACEEGK